MGFGDRLRQLGWQSAAVIAFLTLYPGESAGETPQDPFALTWQAPESCPERAVLTGRVEAFLGQSLEVRRAQQLKIDAIVQEDAAAGFVATVSVTTTEASYERRLDHQDCASLTEAAALVIALAIDPERVRAHQTEAAPNDDADTPLAAPAAPAPPVAAPPVPTVAANSPAPVTPPAQPSAAPSATTAPNPVVIDAGVRALLDVGTLPRAGLGIGGIFAVGVGRLRVELTGTYWFPVEESVPGHAPAAVKVQLATGGLRGCYVWAPSDWALSACAGAELGDYRGRGFNVDDPATSHQLWSAASADLRLSRALTPWFGVFGGIEPGLAITRPRFGVTQGEETVEVTQPGPVFLRTYIGAELSF